jgi:hypothetical protein
MPHTMIVCDRCGFMAVGKDSTTGWKVLSPQTGVCPACLKDEAAKSEALPVKTSKEMHPAPLLRAKGGDWIDVRRAARGQVAGNERQRHEERRSANQQPRSNILVRVVSPSASTMPESASVSTKASAIPVAVPAMTIAAPSRSTSQST